MRWLSEPWLHLQGQGCAGLGDHQVPLEIASGGGGTVRARVSGLSESVSTPGPERGLSVQDSLLDP